MIKNKIFKHFLLEFIKIFLLISVSLSILIWMTQAARLLELVTGYGNSVETYIKYLFYIYPKIFDNIYILSFCVSMFFLLNKFENSKEINIYWLSGIGKDKIINLILFITLLVIIIKLLLGTFFAPWSSIKGREILTNAKFSMINSLVKENNFNSPLKGLTIFVGKNDKKGNLENIFIYEKSRTIIAKKGRVLTNSQNTYLQLFDGQTQEKIKNNINLISFESTIFDFSNYKLQNVSYPKFGERNIMWLIKNYNDNENPKVSEIREEINKRMINPFFIFVLGIVSCFLLYSNSNINLKKYKFFIYCIAFFLIILNQLITSMSGNILNFFIIYLGIIFFLFFSFYYYLKKLLNNENK